MLRAYFYMKNVHTFLFTQIYSTPKRVAFQAGLHASFKAFFLLALSAMDIYPVYYTAPRQTQAARLAEWII